MLWGGVDWINPAHDGNKWQTLENTGIKFLIPSYMGNPQELLVFSSRIEPRRVRSFYEIHG
jgi:hypothetical protein